VLLFFNITLYPLGIERAVFDLRSQADALGAIKVETFG
jgi:hypothetical protein